MDAQMLIDEAVEALDHHLDQVEDAQLRLGAVDDDAKVERRVRRQLDQPLVVHAAVGAAGVPVNVGLAKGAPVTSTRLPDSLTYSLSRSVA